MDGLEAAGTALSAGKLSVSALERWRNAALIGKLHTGWQPYTRDLERLWLDLGHEMTIFSTALGLILESIVPADRLHTMFEEPAGYQWKDASVNYEIQKLLGSTYQRFCEVLNKTAELFIEILHQVFLPIRKARKSISFQFFDPPDDNFIDTDCRKEKFNLLKNDFN